MSYSSVFYQPVQKNFDTQIMNKIDEIFTMYPFYGSRRMVVSLQDYGFQVSRHKVQDLMRKMGIEAIYSKPNLSKPNPEHKVFPYLLRGLTIDRPNHVWSIDITYIRMSQGWLYLTAIIDWFSRFILAWEISNTLDTEFCIKAVEKSLKCGSPVIFNTDQGSQFTSKAFISVILDNKIKLSMDGRGRAFDNIFIERFWRSLKYENIYINDYPDCSHAISGIRDYINFYNTVRPHQSLDYKTPYEVHTKFFS